MFASLLVLANRATQQVQHGSLKLVLVEGEQDVMLLVQARQNSILAVAAKPNHNLGMIFLSTKKFAQKIIAAFDRLPANRLA